MNHARELGLWKEADNPQLFTKKSVAVLGSCYCSKNANGKYESAIIINELLLNYSDNQIRHTLVHEVAHAMHPQEVHSAAWKRDANALGKKWGLTIERNGKYKDINDELFRRKDAKTHYKYEVYCPTCGKSWKYTRMSAVVQNPQKYRCPFDKSELLLRK